METSKTKATAAPAAERPRGRIVVTQDRALIGQVTFKAGTVIGEVISKDLTIEQLCAAVAHGKAGPG